MSTERRAGQTAARSTARRAALLPFVTRSRWTRHRR